MSVLSLALKRLNISALNSEYSLKIYHHIDELGPLLRPPVYGLLARFASQNNYLEEAVGYLLKVPRSERRQVPFCEVGKYCVLQRRPDLVLSLLSASPLESISPELIGHAIASLTMRKAHAQSLSYESLLLDEMKLQNRFIHWVVPFLLASAAQIGHREAALQIFTDYYLIWKKVPSELDYNLLVFSILKSGLTLTSESEIISNFGRLFSILHKMKMLKYGLHAVLRDFDSYHPAVPSEFKDYFHGVKMAMSSLPSVENPCAQITDMVHDGNEFIGVMRNGDNDMDSDSNNDSIDDNSSSDGEDGSSAVSAALAPQSELAPDTRTSRVNQNLNFEDIQNKKAQENEENIDMMLVNLDMDLGPVLEGNSEQHGDDGKIFDRNISTVNQNLRVNYDEINKPSSTYITRVWTPTNSKNVESEGKESDQKKVVKKTASWPLKSNFMLQDENFFEEKDDSFTDDNDIDGETSDMGQTDEERERGRERDRDREKGRDRQEMSSPGGDYFDDSDWLRRKTTSVNFSPHEIKEMNLMEILDLYSENFDEGNQEHENGNRRESRIASVEGADKNRISNDGRNSNNKNTDDDRGSGSDGDVNDSLGRGISVLKDKRDGGMSDMRTYDNDTREGEGADSDPRSRFNSGESACSLHIGPISLCCHGQYRQD